MKKLFLSVALLVSFGAYAEEVVSQATETEMVVSAGVLQRRVWLQETPELYAEYVACTDEERAEFDMFCEEVANANQEDLEVVLMKYATLILRLKERTGLSFGFKQPEVA